MDNGTCAFTGHRNIAIAHRGRINELIFRAISYAYDEGCRTFLSGGAVGFDTLAAREVVRFRMSHQDVRLSLVLPCINQDERWSARERDSYEYLLGAADEVSYVSDFYTADCMKRRNLALATAADIVISYVGRSASGAGQTVRMAERLGKRIYNLYPTLDCIAFPGEEKTGKGPTRV